MEKEKLISFDETNPGKSEYELKSDIQGEKNLLTFKYNENNKLLFI